jgi:hypothetical protein
MVNVAACLRDGYSSTGSLGQGMGAIQRQSQRFDLYSAPGPPHPPPLAMAQSTAPSGESRRMAMAGLCTLPRITATCCSVTGWATGRTRRLSPSAPWRPLPWRRPGRPWPRLKPSIWRSRAVAAQPLPWLRWLGQRWTLSASATSAGESG